MTTPQDIESFLAAYPPQVGELAHAARRLLGEALPGSEETLDKTARVIGVGYGPGYKGCVCTLIMSQKGVKLGIVAGRSCPTRRGSWRGAVEFIGTCNWKSWRI